jgi:triacylglycerol lipase
MRTDENQPMNLVFASGVLVPQHIAGHDYFRGLREAFPLALFPSVPVTSSIDVRARALAEQVRSAFPTGPTHVIAHSMGGLDTRCVLHRNLSGLADPNQVVSLSTISTPHRGSPIADLLVSSRPDGPGLRSFAYDVLKHAFEFLGISITALGELTTGFLETFNAQYPNVSHVRYRSYAGNGTASIVLKPFHQYLQTIGHNADECANDGVVSVASAKWGAFIEPTWPTDHFGELGYSFNLPSLQPTFDHLSAIRRVVERASQEHASSQDAVTV